MGRHSIGSMNSACLLGKLVRRKWLILCARLSRFDAFKNHPSRHPRAFPRRDSARWFGRSYVHFPVGTRRFSSSNQFCTTMICVSDEGEIRSFALSIKKRWPSGDTS